MLSNLNARLIKAIVLIALLAGCENRNSQIEALEDYQHRIHNILDLQNDRQLIQAPNFEAARYPHKRELTIPTSEVKITWSDFFNLNHCQQLQQVVAQRNNQLGKNMETATQLLYEINLLRSFTHCQKQREEFTEEHLKAFEVKQTELPRNIWNNTWASNYWQSLFTHQRKHHATSKSEISHLISGLSSVRQQIQLNLATNSGIASPREVSKQEINSHEWYKAFQTIESTQGLIGSLSYELQSHINLLNIINIELDKSKEKVCRGNKPSKAFEYLWNVLNKFYLTDIQKRQGELISMASDLAIEFSEWEVIFPTRAGSSSNTFFTEWYRSTFRQDSDVNLVEKLKSQIKSHVSIWQELQEMCKGD